jgi:predicted dehydrogenase/nucleoside-diphosphate-sugar epimerase
VTQLAPDSPRLSSRPRRVALVGAGWIADAHAEVLAALPGVEIALVCDPDRARAERLARRFGVARVETSLEALDPRTVDVAHLLVPPDLHERLAREILEKGVGVFVEKPLALSAAAARELGAIAASKGLALGANHNFVHHPAFVRLLAEVRSGAIGRVEHVRAVLATPLAQLEAGQFGHWMFRAPANIVYEQAVHPLALVHALVGKADRVESTILSTRELLPGQRFHDRWSVAATAGKVSVELHLAFGAGFEQFRVEVRGTDGVLEADLRRDALTGETKSRWLEFYDGYLATAGRAKRLRHDARATLVRYLRSTLGLARREDGFFASMRASIEAFHPLARASGAGRGGPRVVRRGRARGRAARAAGRDPRARPAARPRGRRPRRERFHRAPHGREAPRARPAGHGGRAPHGLAPPELAQGAADGRVRIFRGSLEDRASLDEAFAGAQSVLHLATGGGDTWEAVERSMVKGSVTVAEAALTVGAWRFVYVSSIAALDTGAIEADSPNSPRTDPRPDARPVYARGKIAAEKALAALHRERGLPLVIARPGVVLGAGTPMQHSGLGLWTRDNHCVGWGPGDHPLPLVWVDDVADALARIVLHAGRDLEGKALNLCAAPPVVGARDGRGAEARNSTGPALPRAAARVEPGDGDRQVDREEIGGRRDAEFPSWHDLRARALPAAIPSDTARAVLGWKPVEDREGFLERTVRIYG